MSSGLKVLLPNNNIIIDQNYSNLKLVRTGVSIQGSGYSGSDNWKNEANKIDISCLSGKPVVLVRPGSRWIGMGLQTFEGVEGFFYASANGGYSPAFGFEYAVFDEFGGGGESGNFGLKVFKDDGTAAFDSRFRYMEVIQVMTVGTFPDYDQSAASASHISEANAWYVMGTVPSGQQIQFDVGIFAWFMPMIRQSTSSSISYKMVEVVAGPNGTKRSQNPIVVCRLTG